MRNPILRNALLMAALVAAPLASAPSATAAGTEPIRAPQVAKAAMPLLAPLPSPQAADEIAPDSPRWEFRAREHRVEEHLGRTSLYLKGGEALVRDSAMTDGVLEFDVAFTGERGFIGGVWRAAAWGEHEEFYLRPHQSGNPDANQYTPAFHGITCWQLYYGEGYGTPVRYANNTWIPVRIVVAGPRAEIYIGDMSKPILNTHDQKRAIAAGRVGLTVGNFAAGWFTRFRFTPMSAAQAAALIVNPPHKIEPGPPGTVMNWRVSDTFDEKSLATKFQLTAADQAARVWTPLAAEPNGLANLARVQGIAEGKDTVFARVTVTSDRDQVKKLRFGFSEHVKVYFNGTLLYGGQDDYSSRDYRFLGTIGLFDEVYLPLKKGENELWFAVTETFGGWGLIARFEDPAGITWK